MVIKFYDTMTGKKVEFKPKEEGNLYIYVCGFTPNNYPHVGHARTAIIFDIIRRVFAKNGYNVHYLTNFTDIDDKIIAKANEEGISYEDVSYKYISAYLKAMELLNVSPPIMYARVTENIDIIVEMISGLIEKKHAYESNGDVYFSVRSFKNYGKLSKRSIREMLIGARVEPEEGKKDPLDFALWKKAKEGEPHWDSPWGKGRPGWHIECSAMSLK
ncbi:MAG TPA: class I tRNA ligase family protein, partial [Caldisericia bacterium]|nr:class I tRNA ligase family protein [Caldisericia bacterium]